MKKSVSRFIQFAGIFVITLLMCGCNSIQPVLLLRPSDFIILGIICACLSLFLSLYMTNGVKNRKFWFWLCFIAGFFLPPALIIAAIIKYALAKE